MSPGQIWSDLILADKILKIQIGIISNNWPVPLDVILSQSHAIIVMKTHPGHIFFPIFMETFVLNKSFTYKVYIA